jgi:hypothetical protein
MSMSIHACWKGPLAVTRDRLQAALAELGFQATILHELEGAEGYWPIDIDGCKTGVEIYFDSDLGELTGHYPVLAAALADRDSVATFVWGGDFAEGAAAIALAAAVARLREGILYDPQDAECLSVETATSDAKEMFEYARKEGYRERADE